jgi:hypothetical protein
MKDKKAKNMKTSNLILNTQKKAKSKSNAEKKEDQRIKSMSQSNNKTNEDKNKDRETPSTYKDDGDNYDNGEHEDKLDENESNKGINKSTLIPENLDESITEENDQLAKIKQQIQ